MNSTIKMISYMGIYLGIFIIFSFVPYIGYIAFGPISITTIPLLCFVIIFIHQDWKYALFTGLAFGILSMIRAAIMPNGPIDPYFVNPLVSVLPRVIFTMFVWVLVSFTSKHLKNQKYLYLIALPIIFVSLVLHSFLVLLMLFAFLHSEIAKIFALIITTNSLIELGIVLVSVPFLYKRISAVHHDYDNENNTW